MMQFPTDICGVKLKNKTAAIQYMRSMIKKYKFGESLQHSDLLFVKTLLHFHDQYQEKAGCGVDTIFVAISEFNKKALFIRRTDGSVIDFSWQNIIKSKHPHADLFFALREAVYPQIKEFKENLFQDNQWIRCSLSKQKLSWETTHIDHQYPLTFYKLVEQWLASGQYHASDIKIVDCGETKEMADKKQKACWYAFHQKTARLRALHQTVNLALGSRNTEGLHE
jgi:hypothetical protein